MARAHEAHEDLRHAEIPETPRQAAHDADRAGAVDDRIAELRHAVDDLLHAVFVKHGRCRGRARKETRYRAQKRDGVLDAAGHGDASHEDDDQRDDHDGALDEVGRADREIAADEGVGEDHERADDHHRRIVDAEQRREELAEGDEAAAGIDAEEHQDDDGGGAHEHLPGIMEPTREIIGKRDRIPRNLRVLPQRTSDETPVEIRSRSQAYGGPDRIGCAGEVRDAGKAHEEPARHVGRFRRKRREPGAEPAAADEVAVAVGIRPLYIEESHREDDDEIEGHGKQDPEVMLVRCDHMRFPSLYGEGRL